MAGSGNTTSTLDSSDSCPSIPAARHARTISTTSSSPSTTSGSTCVCSNIAIMQLFHEMKAQFPNVADHVVSQCVSEHLHDRDACRAYLSVEQARVPRGVPYPPVLMGNMREVPPLKMSSSCCNKSGEAKRCEKQITAVAETESVSSENTCDPDISDTSSDCFKECENYCGCSDVSKQTSLLCELCNRPRLSFIKCKTLHANCRKFESSSSVMFKNNVLEGDSLDQVFIRTKKHLKKVSKKHNAFGLSKYDPNLINIKKTLNKVPLSGLKSIKNKVIRSANMRFNSDKRSNSKTHNKDYKSSESLTETKPEESCKSTDKSMDKKNNNNIFNASNITRRSFMNNSHNTENAYLFTPKLNITPPDENKESDTSQTLPTDVSDSRTFSFQMKKSNFVVNTDSKDTTNTYSRYLKQSMFDNFNRPLKSLTNDIVNQISLLNMNLTSPSSLKTKSRSVESVVVKNEYFNNKNTQQSFYKRTHYTPYSINDSDQFNEQTSTSSSAFSPTENTIYKPIGPNVSVAEQTDLSFEFTKTPPTPRVNVFDVTQIPGHEYSSNFTDASKNLKFPSDQLSNQKPPIPKRPTTLDLKPDQFYNSERVNVNVNVDFVSVSPTRRTTVINLNPEPVWSSSSDIQSPRSFTSVNLTLRPPALEPQDPIDIQSANSRLTYSTSSFDPNKGFQNSLQITVGPTGGTVSAIRTRPRSSYLPEHQHSPIMLSTRAGSLPDLYVIDSSRLQKQIERKERLRIELVAERGRLGAMQREVEQLEATTTEMTATTFIKYERQLRCEIQHLLEQCRKLAEEVDRHSQSVPLGEISEEFYENIYRGQSGPLWMPNVPEDEESHWTCSVCTFSNHPLMDNCEQCSMPRIGLNPNSHEHFSHNKNESASISAPRFSYPSNPYSHLETQ